MPVINGINMQYNGGVGDEEVRRSEAATQELRRAVADMAGPGRSGTWETASRQPNNSIIGSATR